MSFYNCDKNLNIIFVIFVLLFLSLTVNAAEEIFFTILHTNDEHSSLLPRGPAADFHPYLADTTRGGVARAAYLLQNIREEKEAAGEDVLLLSAGDFIGGSPFAWLNLIDYSPELSIMQTMGYDAVVIGNHEFDYGPDNLARFLINAGYPEAHEKTVLLGANIRVPSEHPLQEAQIRDTHSIELEQGLKIGLFGLLGREAFEIITSAPSIEFLDPLEAAQKAVEKLQSQGAQIIIALTHSGVLEDRELARKVPGIDVIVGGHCHTPLYTPLIEGDTLIVQAGAYHDYVGVLELAYNPLTRTLRQRNEETEQPYLMPVHGAIPLQEDIQNLVDDYTHVVNEFLKSLTGGDFEDILAPVVYGDFSLPRRPYRQETPMGNYITDAMRIKGEKITGERVDFAFLANGQIRGEIVPGKMEHSRGLVTIYDLLELSSLGIGDDGKPGYSLASVYLTGREIRHILELSIFLSIHRWNSLFLQVSGLRFDYNHHRATLARVPFLNFPLPTGRGVVSAERYTEEGLQTVYSRDYTSIKRDETLYHVVVDAFSLSILPMIGDIFPYMRITPKNSQGLPIEDLSEATIYRGDREFKVWEVILYYAASHAQNKEGFPVIPEYYSSTSERIIEVWRPPLLYYPGGFIALLLRLLLFP